MIRYIHLKQIPSTWYYVPSTVDHSSSSWTKHSASHAAVGHDLHLTKKYRSIYSRSIFQVYISYIYEMHHKRFTHHRSHLHGLICHRSVVCYTWSDLHDLTDLIRPIICVCLRWLTLTPPHPTPSRTTPHTTQRQPNPTFQVDWWNQKQTEHTTPPQQQ